MYIFDQNLYKHHSCLLYCCMFAFPTALWVTSGEEEGAVASHGGHSGRIPGDGRKEEMCYNTR